MFLGQYHCPLVNKNLLIVPAHFREQLSAGAFIVQGFDRNIMVLTMEAFQEIYERVVKMNIADPAARLLLRMILGNASELKMNKSGQLTIPENLADFAALEGEAVIVGMGRYFEVWAPELWHQQEIRLQDTEANANRFATLSIVA